MGREKLELRHLPAALDEVAGKRSAKKGLSGAVLLALFAVAIFILGGVLDSSTIAVGGMLLLGAAAGLAIAGRGTGISDLGEAASRAAKAARDRRMRPEALAALEACALHRRRIHSAAGIISQRGAHWAVIAEDAKRAADASFIRALEASVLLVGRGTRKGSLGKAVKELLDGDLDDAVKALTKWRDGVHVDTRSLPAEVMPVVEVARDLKRLASELESQRPAVNAVRQPSETDELIERLRLTREAEQELHRDVNA